MAKESALTRVLTAASMFVFATILVVMAFRAGDTWSMLESVDNGSSEVKKIRDTAVWASVAAWAGAAILILMGGYYVFTWNTETREAVKSLRAV